MTSEKRRHNTPTIRDVARLAGVSVATASRVVRRENSVRPEKVEAVEAAVEELGYVPNAAARGLVEQKLGAIALIIPEREGMVFSDPFFGAIVSGIVPVLEAAHKQLILVMSGTHGTEDKLRRFLHGNHCDGAILASHHEGDELRKVLQSTTLPLVSLGAPLRGVDLPFVDLDNEKGGQLAAQRLLNRGAKAIAIIQGPTDMAASVDRVRGFTRELAVHNLKPVTIIDADYSPASGTKAAQQLIDSRIAFDAVFSANDLMALAANQTFRRHYAEQEFPLVMGFDNIDVDRAELAGLTTISNPVVDMGARCAELLLDVIAGTASTRKIIFEPQLVARTTA